MGNYSVHEIKMNFLTFICSVALFISFSSILTVQGCDIEISGYTWYFSSTQHQPLKNFTARSVEECANDCFQDSECIAYTWSQKFSEMCSTFSRLEGLYYRRCDSYCKSGTVPQVLTDTDCSSSGSNIITSLPAESRQLCEDLCVEDDTCSNYTWMTNQGLCHLLTSCDEQVHCPSCVSGTLICLYETE